MELNNISEGKYKFKNTKIDGGAFSKIYNLDKKDCKDKKYIVKIHNRKSRSEAINEIEVLLKLKKNKKKFKLSINSMKLNESFLKSKLAKIKDYYITDDYVYTVFKKYNITLDSFNIQYNKTFNETLPLQLIKKISNSLFLGLHELKVSKIIHCDIKPNNILIDLVYYKSIKDLFKDIKNKKVKKEDITKFIDIKIIDFNKSEEYKSIYKSLNIQTLYYTPPEIILGNRNYNYSVDVWAVGLILYELTTSLFLFDVYNLNHEYGMNYKNYESDSESNEESESNSESSDSYSYGDDDSFNNLALMHIYKSKLGDNEMRYGKYVNTFYSNDILMGCYQKTNIKKDVEFTELKNILNKSLSNNEKIFYNTIYELFKEIFVYDYNNRLTTEIYFNKFLF
jgi:serine/threonine protein kinase